MKRLLKKFTKKKNWLEVFGNQKKIVPYSQGSKKKKNTTNEKNRQE